MVFHRVGEAWISGGFLKCKTCLSLLFPSSVSPGISRDLGVLQFFLPVLFIYCHCPRFITSGFLWIFPLPFFPSGFPLSSDWSLLYLLNGFAIFVFISCSSSPEYKVMKAASRSSLPHRQASAKEYLARPCSRFMPFRIGRQLSALVSIRCYCSFDPVTRELLTPPRSTLHPRSPFPMHWLQGPLVASVFFFLNFILWVFTWKQKDVSAFLLVLTMRIKAGGTDIFLPLTCLHSRLNVYFWADVLIANYIWKRRQTTQLVRVDGIKAKFTGFASGVSDATLKSDQFGI